MILNKLYNTLNYNFTVETLSIKYPISKFKNLIEWNLVKMCKKAYYEISEYLDDASNQFAKIVQGSLKKTKP